MASKDNEGDKIASSSSEDEVSSPPRKILKESSEVEQQGPTKYCKLLARLDALKSSLNIVKDKLEDQTCEVFQIDLDEKEKSPVWFGNEVVASAISRVRKLQTSETSDLSDGSFDLRGRKVPKLEFNVDSDISTSSWIGPEAQSPLEGSSFDNSNVTISPISIWKGRQFHERQIDDPNISRRTWATSDTSELSLSVEIPTLGDLAFSTASFDSTPTPGEEKINLDGLAAAFERLTCNTQSPKQGSRITPALKLLSCDLFGANRRRSPGNHELSGIEPLSDEFSSFSDSNASSLDSIGGRRFRHSTPNEQAIEDRVQQSESDFFSDDGSYSSNDF